MSGTYVLITGAGGGIGSAMAIEFASRGYNLILSARTTKSLAPILENLSEYPVKVASVCADLTAIDGPDLIVKELRTRKINVAYLVNNAGFGEFGAFESSDNAMLMGMIDVNVRSLTSLTKLLLPQIIEQKGGILNVASVAGFMPGPMKAVYFASKAYVLSFSLALKQELVGSVHVSVLCPGPTKSRFWASTASMKRARYSQVTFMTSERVAKVAVTQFLKGKGIITPGFLNKANTLFPRLVPGTIMAKIVDTLFSLR